MLLALVLLGEALTPAKILAMALIAVGTGLIEKHRQCIQHRTAQSLQGIQKGKFKGHG